MINISTEFQQAHARNSACIVKANILLKDGTQLNVDNSQISQGATKIDDGVSGSNTFEIGSAIVNKLTLNLNNRYDEFSDYDFTDAVVTAWVGKQLPSRIEWLKKGVYNTDDPTSTPAILTLECLDNMSKFDQVYDGGMTFPTTLQAMVQYCCTRCGVLLANAQFPNYLYEISRDPFGGTNNITYRAIIAYCALLAGCYARCNVDGRLELKWYAVAVFEDNIDGGIFDKTTADVYRTGNNLDGGNFTDYNSGDNADGGNFADTFPYHHIYSFSSLSVSTEDVVITGIRVTAADSEDESGNKVEGETYLCGAEGYILDVSGNPLIKAGKARDVAEYLAGRIVGMRFRPFQASAIGDPSWEAGDAAIITDRKGNSYYTYLTNITYSTGSYASISCDVEPAARHSADRYAEINKIVSDIKKDNQQKLSQYAQYVDQLNTLAINAMGYYETVEKQDDGSIIKYMHDKPLLSESQTIFKNSIDGFFWSRDGGKTYTFGVSKDGNAVMSVIAAIGIAAEWIDTRGFKATDDAGNVTFEIDANTGKVRIVCESFSLTGKSIEEISQMATEDIINAVASDLQSQVDGKIESYNQSSDPSTTWTSTAVKQAHKGDLWYWNNVTKRWNGAAWETLPVSDEAARELAQSKKRIFVSQPIPPYDVGDLWVQGSNGDIMRCKIARVSGNHMASDWEKASKYTDDSAVKDLDEKLSNSEEIFNRLTNNGTIQGIYMLNGQLYINFNYARGGTLTLGGLNNVNGDLKVINADGEETCVMNKDEVRITGDMAIKSKSTQFSNRVFAKFGNTTMPDGGGNVRKYDGFEIYNEKYPDDKLSIMPAGKVSSSGGTSFHATPIIYADTSMNIKGGRASLELEGSAKLAGIINDEFSTFTLRGNEFSIGVGNTSGSYTLMRSSYGNGAGFDGEILVQGALRATGGKTRVVSTDNYGTVSLNAVESPECYFSEFGGGEIGEEGKCYVFFEPIFLETVNLLFGYRVQVTPTSQGRIKYIEKKLDYFIVYGSIGTTFDFTIYAKQKGFESDRLEQISLPKEKPSENETVLLDDNTDNDANAYLENYEKEILSYD